ncbi:hypothetical protein OG292_02630 [Streptomyces sp. NBC_01511]|uniref:hypothetical protein n=1 Tax=unclassified Streptomyces TaxID=2593676 RepID=UPI0038655EB4
MQGQVAALVQQGAQQVLGSEDEYSGWCWGDSAPRYSSPGSDPFDCKAEIAQVEPGEDTYSDHFADADSFRVDSGCKTTFERSADGLGPDLWPAPGDHTYVEDRRGKAGDSGFAAVLESATDNEAQASE